VVAADLPLLNNTLTIEGISYKSFEELKEVLNQAAQDVYSVKQKELGIENIKEIERQIMLHVIDSKWVDHLHNMDALRDGIHLRGYGQKDPLMEYKKEAFDMFEQLLIDVKREAVVLLMHAQIEAVEHDSEHDGHNHEDDEESEEDEEEIEV
jgi:preprotein translocase subunit SecA